MPVKGAYNEEVEEGWVGFRVCKLNIVRTICAGVSLRAGHQAN